MHDDDHPQDSGGEASLWEYCLRVYADKAVSQACLAAQDTHNLDVCLLLYLAWLADRGEQISESQLGRVVNACKDWRNSVVLPLRKQRRRWKAVGPESWEYAALKKLEQQAEREQLSMLETLLARSEIHATRDTTTAFKENLDNLLRCFDLPRASLHEFFEAVQGVDA